MTTYATPTASARERIYERRWLTLGVLALSFVILALDTFVLNVALPTLQRSFDADASQLQWMVDAYILVYAGLILSMGALGDRAGRARVLQVGLLLFGATSIGATFATTAGQLIAARAIMGVGAAMIFPSTLSIIINVFPREERARAIAAWAATAGLGIGLGPITGGFLIENFAWQAVFLINVPVALAALALSAILVPDSRDPEHATIDLPGAALSIAAVTILVYAIIDAPRAGWTDSTVLGAFALAAVLALAFVWYELRAARPMVDFSLFRDRRLSAGAAAVAFYGFTLFSTIFGLTLYVQFVLGRSPIQAGAIMLPIGLAAPLGAGASVRLVRRFGTKLVVAAGLLVMAAILLSFQLWTVSTESWVVALTLFVAGLAAANVAAPSAAAIMEAVPEERAGIGSAINVLAAQLAGALGVAIVGSLMNTVYRDRMAEAVRGLPPSVAGLASDSVGGAMLLAARLPGPAAQQLLDHAHTDFVSALTTGVLVPVGVLALGALIVLGSMPARALPAAPRSAP